MSESGDVHIVEEISLSLRNIILAIREPEAKDHTGKRDTKRNNEKEK